MYLLGVVEKVDLTFGMIKSVIVGRIFSLSSLGGLGERVARV